MNVIPLNQMRRSSLPNRTMAKMTFAFICKNCGETWYATAIELNHEDSPTEMCPGCENQFCHPCFRRHDCYFHEAESVDCMGCGKEILIDEKNRPAIIEGDPYCLKCATKEIKE
jgi:hypothetical protein